MRYKEYMKLLENKNRFIDKNENLTIGEKEYYKKFFAEHPEQEGKIKNWSFNLKKEDFDKVVYDYDNNLSKLPTETLKDLKEGWDYNYFGELLGYKMYFVYTHKASWTLASNNVGTPLWSPLPGWYAKSNTKDDYLYDRRTKKYSGAKWCTAMHHTDQYFNSYVHDYGICYIYCLATDSIVKNTAISPNETKLAVTVYFTGKVKAMYDAFDMDYEDNTFKSKLEGFIQTHFDDFVAYCDSLKVSVGYIDNEEDIQLADEEDDDEPEFFVDEMDRAVNFDYVNQHLRLYFNDHEEVLIGDGIDDFVQLVGSPINYFLDTARTLDMVDNTNRTLIEQGKEYIDKYLNMQDKALIGKFSTDVSKIRDLKHMFGQDNTKESRESSIFYKYFTESSDTQTYSLLDFLYLTLHYIYTKFTTARMYHEDMVYEMVSKSFRDNDNLYKELLQTIRSYDSSDLKAKAEGASNSYFENQYYVVGKEFDSAEDLVSLLILIYIRFNSNFSRGSINNNKSDTISFLGYNTNASRLEGFFARIARVLFDYIKIDDDSYFYWWSIVAGTIDFTTYNNQRTECCPIAVLGNYAYDKYMIEQFLESNNFNYYLATMNSNM